MVTDCQNAFVSKRSRKFLVKWESNHRVITCQQSWRHRRLETERWPPL